MAGNPSCLLHRDDFSKGSIIWEGMNGDQDLINWFGFRTTWNGKSTSFWNDMLINDKPFK